MEISEGQQKRVNKIQRLREFFKGKEVPEIYSYAPGDEVFSFELMSDLEVERYLGEAKRREKE